MSSTIELKEFSHVNACACKPRSVYRPGRVGFVCCGVRALGDDDSPAVEEKQLPFAMHSRMTELPTIRVGNLDADLIGADHRALQAAVDYIAGLGGGVVEIGPGEFHMGDSLHLRSNVTVRGQKGQDDPPEK